MTPNDIHANQTTSFVRIQQWKLQAVSRIVLGKPYAAHLARLDYLLIYLPTQV